nr:S-layer homology domain-containing protein [uncultured Agathobaculum sp.]
MKRRSAIAMALGAALLLPANAHAVSVSDFSDFPSDWSAQALESAVENGLLNGSGGRINASGSLTRTEMAAIVNRAFGSSNPASLSGYSDVSPDAWYHEDMAMAVQMGSFQGADGKLNPSARIIREEAFTVLSRAFLLDEGGYLCTEPIS